MGTDGVFAGEEPLRPLRRRFHLSWRPRKVEPKKVAPQATPPHAQPPVAAPARNPPPCEDQLDRSGGVVASGLQGRCLTPRLCRARRIASTFALDAGRSTFFPVPGPRSPVSRPASPLLLWTLDSRLWTAFDCFSVFLGNFFPCAHPSTCVFSGRSFPNCRRIGRRDGDRADTKATIPGLPSAPKETVQQSAPEAAVQRRGQPI